MARSAPVDALEAGFAAAATARGVVERSFAVAGRGLRLRFAGEALVSTLTQALAHLPPAPGRGPCLTVDLWDSTSTGTRPPPPPDAPPTPAEAVGASVLLRADGLRLVHQPGYQTLTAIDLDRSRGWFWVASAEGVPFREWAQPVHLNLNWWLATQGGQLVHAGAVGTPEGGVLLVGRAGSGKSTAALACLAAGLGYAGDNYVAVVDGDPPWAHGVYSSGKLHPDHATRFPHLRPDPAERVDADKDMFFVSELYPELMATGFPLRAVLLPRLAPPAPGSGAGPGRPDTRLEPVSAASALAALAPSTVLQLPGAGAEELRAQAEIVRRLPAYVLELGHDLEGIAPVIRSLLGQR